MLAFNYGDASTETVMQILVVDDQQVLCVAFCSHLERIAPKYTTTPVAVKPCFGLEDAVTIIESDDPLDLVFLDLNLGSNSNGAATFEQFQAHNKRRIPVAVFTGLDPNDEHSIDIFRKCIQLNAAGILLKGGNLNQAFMGIDRLLHREFFFPPEILKGLATVAPIESPISNTEWGLSPREWAVASGISRGLQNKTIAHENKLSEAYVRQVASQIYNKLGVRTRTQAAIKLAPALKQR